MGAMLMMTMMRVMVVMVLSSIAAVVVVVADLQLSWVFPHTPYAQFTGGTTAILYWNNGDFWDQTTDVTAMLINPNGTINQTYSMRPGEWGITWSVPNYVTQPNQLWTFGVQYAANATTRVISSPFFIVAAYQSSVIRWMSPTDRLADPTTDVASYGSDWYDGNWVTLAIGIPQALIDQRNTTTIEIQLWWRLRYNASATPVLLSTIATGMVPTQSYQTFQWQIDSGTNCGRALRAYYMVLSVSSTASTPVIPFSVKMATSELFVLGARQIPTRYPLLNPYLTTTTTNRTQYAAINLFWAQPLYDYELGVRIYAGNSTVRQIFASAQSCDLSFTYWSVDTRYLTANYLTIMIDDAISGRTVGNATITITGVRQSRYNFNAVPTYDRFFGGYYGLTFSYLVDTTSSSLVAAISSTDLDFITPTGAVFRLRSAIPSPTYGTYNSVYLSPLQLLFIPALQLLSSGTGYLRVTNTDNSLDTATTSFTFGWQGATQYFDYTDVKYRLTIGASYSVTFDTERAALRASLLTWLQWDDSWVSSMSYTSTYDWTTYTYTYYCTIDMYGYNNSATDLTTSQSTLQSSQALQLALQLNTFLVTNQSLLTAAGYTWLRTWDIQPSQVSWARCPSAIVYRQEYCPYDYGEPYSYGVNAGAIVGIFFGVFFGIVIIAVISLRAARGVCCGCCPCCWAMNAHHRRRPGFLAQLLFGAALSATVSPQPQVVYVNSPQAQQSQQPQPQQQPGGVPRPAYPGQPVNGQPVNGMVAPPSYATMVPGATGAAPPPPPGGLPSYDAVRMQQQQPQHPSYAPVNGVPQPMMNQQQQPMMYSNGYMASPGGVPTAVPYYPQTQPGVPYALPIGQAAPHAAHQPPAAYTTPYTMNGNMYPPPHPMAYPHPGAPVAAQPQAPYVAYAPLPSTTPYGSGQQPGAGAYPPTAYPPTSSPAAPGGPPLGIPVSPQPGPSSVAAASSGVMMPTFAPPSYDGATMAPPPACDPPVASSSSSGFVSVEKPRA